MKVWMATASDTDLEDVPRSQACTSRAAALHWLAHEAIPTESWYAFFDSVDPEDRPGVTRDRIGMTDEQILAFWIRPVPDTTDQWGDGEYVMAIEEQEVYSDVEPSEIQVGDRVRIGTFTPDHVVGRVEGTKAFILALDSEGHATDLATMAPLSWLVRVDG